MPLKDRTTRLESPRTLRDDAPNTYADNTPDSLQLQRERYHSGLTPRIRHPLEPVLDAAEIPGSAIRSVIHAFQNFKKPAYERGGEPFLGTNILGHINNGENDQSFMNAQRIARPGAGLLEQSAIRLGTDPGFVGNLPALGKAAYRGLGSAAKAVRSRMPRRRSKPTETFIDIDGNKYEFDDVDEIDLNDLGSFIRSKRFRVPRPISRPNFLHTTSLDGGVDPPLEKTAWTEYILKQANEAAERLAGRRVVPETNMNLPIPERPAPPILPKNKTTFPISKYRRPDMIEPFREIAPGYRMGSEFWHAKPPPGAWGGNPKPLDPGNRLTPFWRKPPI